MLAKWLTAIAAAGFYFFAQAGAAAAAPPSVYIEELTWVELKAAVAAGATTVIIPVGGTEQNGPFIALGKHNQRARILAGRIAEKLGNALVAPVVAYVPEGTIDPPEAHMKFPGSITIDDKTFEALLVSAALSFAHAGFRDVVLIGDHGGYQRDLTVAAGMLNQKWKSGPIHAHAVLEYYRVSQTEYVEALKKAGMRGDEIGTHAALADTSLALALTPGLVRVDQLKTAGEGAAGKQGIYGGSPRRSSAELGNLGVELIIQKTVDAIKAAVGGH